MIAAKGDDVARLVEGCNCKDALFRGPICKHAAACLIAERRRVHQPIADGNETPAEQKISPTSGKWLLDRFRTLTSMGRLRPKEKPKKALLAIKASSHIEDVVIATAVAAPASRIKSAVKTTQTPVVPLSKETPPELTWAADDAPGRCAVTMLGGPAAQDRVIDIIQI